MLRQDLTVGRMGNGFLAGCPEGREPFVCSMCKHSTSAEYIGCSVKIPEVAVVGMGDT